MNAIQSFQFNDIPVSFRDDGYLNATMIASHFGKLPKDYLKSEQTQQYISVLAENLSVRRKILTKENQIVIVKRGGIEQGTWLHPKLAVHFARWLDPKFAVWCDEQIEQILSGSLQASKALPSGLTHEQQEQVKALHRMLVGAVPREHQAKLAITLWSSIKIQIQSRLQRRATRTVPRSVEPDEPRGGGEGRTVQRSRHREFGNRAEAVRQSG